MALAAAGNPKDAYTMGKITALEARAVGIHWIYAPDSDVNNNPDNPIINTRSFGENPQKVAEYVSAFVHGVQENGGLATAKHFPGHGDTAADSHIDLPVIRADRDRLENLELVPFRAAIAAGADSIMTGHLSIPALEPDPNTPATLSSNILTGSFAQRTWLPRIGGHRRDGHGRYHGALRAGRSCGARVCGGGGCAADAAGSGCGDSMR